MRRLRWKHSPSLKVANEPVLAFTQGSPERDALQKVPGWGARGCRAWSGSPQDAVPAASPTHPAPSPRRQPGVWRGLGLEVVEVRAAGDNQGPFPGLLGQRSCPEVLPSRHFLVSGQNLKIMRFHINFRYSFLSLQWADLATLASPFCRVTPLGQSPAVPEGARALRVPQTAALTVSPPGQLHHRLLTRAVAGGETAHAHACPYLTQALRDLKGQTEAIPCVVGDEEVWTSDVQYQLSVGPVGGEVSAALSPSPLTAREHRAYGLCFGEAPVPSQLLSDMDP